MSDLWLMRLKGVAGVRLVVLLAAACGEGDSASVDRRVCDAAGRSVKAFIEASVEESVAAAQQAYRLAEDAERSDIREAAGMVGLAAEVAERRGMADRVAFDAYTDAVRRLDKLCIEHDMT